MPVRLQPRRQADSALLQGVADRGREGGRAWEVASRFLPDGREESRTRRRVGEDCHAAHGAQDAIGVRPLRHHQRAGSPRRREQTRVSRDKTGQSAGDAETDDDTRAVSA